MFGSKTLSLAQCSFVPGLLGRGGGTDTLDTPPLLAAILTVTLCADASTALHAEHSDASFLCTFWSVDEMNVCDYTVEVEAAPDSGQSRYAVQFLRKGAP